MTQMSPGANAPPACSRLGHRLAVSFSVCLASLLGLWLSGCGWGSDDHPSVVVYTALDRGFSEPILNKFEQETGIRVQARYDTESTKTVGLVNAIRGEKQRPRCDVFWNNEIVNTIRLQNEGLLEAYAPAAAAQFPAPFKDATGYWINTDLVPPGAEPKLLAELAEAKWQGKVAIAKPLFGTTATQAACLDALWGTERAAAWFAALKANGVRIESSNKAVALAVGAGRAAVGITDTDDAIEELASHRPVKIIYPDAGPDQDGVLFIPNTLALVKGAPHPEAARKLIEFLLRPEIETMLANGPSAQIPLNPLVTTVTQVETPKTVKAMPVDFAKAAEAYERVARYLEDNFLK
jgi:iron(III) transport system substrate-binding protein